MHGPIAAAILSRRAPRLCIAVSVASVTPAIAPFVGSDRPLLAELALHGRLEYVPEELFLWRDHPDRSVRLQRRDRLAWFDASARSIFSTLFLQQLWANQKAALRTPRSYRDKARAFGRTLRWGLQNRGMLLRDMRAVAGALLRRLMPAGRRAQ